MDLYYGIRLCVIALLVVTLSVTIFTATTLTNILSSILLFLLPMILDYFSQMPVSSTNQRRKAIVVWVSIFASAITIAMFLIPFGNIDVSGNQWWKVILCLVFVAYIGIAILDWIGNSTPEEKENRKMLREAVDGQQKKSKSSTKKHSGVAPDNPTTT